jgi:hypothetical protein
MHAHLGTELVNAPLVAHEAKTATAFMTALHAGFLERFCRPVHFVVAIKTRSDAPRSSSSRIIERCAGCSIFGRVSAEGGPAASGRGLIKLRNAQYAIRRHGHGIVVRRSLEALPVLFSFSSSRAIHDAANGATGRSNLVKFGFADCVLRRRRLTVRLLNLRPESVPSGRRRPIGAAARDRVELRRTEQTRAMRNRLASSARGLEQVGDLSHVRSFTGCFRWAAKHSRFIAH